MVPLDQVVKERRVARHSLKPCWSSLKRSVIKAVQRSWRRQLRAEIAELKKALEEERTTQQQIAAYNSVERLQSTDQSLVKQREANSPQRERAQPREEWTSADKAPARL